MHLTSEGLLPKTINNYDFFKIKLYDHRYVPNYFSTNTPIVSTPTSVLRVLAALPISRYLKM